jgi:hypothetical protein
MFPWFPTAMLAAESHRVIALRMLALSGGGTRASQEALKMTQEKYFAAFEAGTQLMMGASQRQIIAYYRRKVRSNSKRLSRPRKIK